MLNVKTNSECVSCVWYVDMFQCCAWGGIQKHPTHCIVFDKRGNKVYTKKDKDENRDNRRR